MAVFSAYRWRKALLVFSALLLLVQLAAVSSQAQTPVTTCGTNITTPGHYLLVNDLNCSRDGIDINAEDVELSLGGHRISGTQSGWGIDISNGQRTNVRVLGPGTITGFTMGVRIWSVNGPVEVMGVTLIGAKQYGFGSAGSYTVKLVGNTASQSQWGYRMLRNYDSEISGNTANGNTEIGIEIVEGERNQVMHNMALNNGFVGIATGDRTFRNRFEFNTAMGNTEFDMYESDQNCRNVWEHNTFRRANLPWCIH